LNTGHAAFTLLKFICAQVDGGAACVWYSSLAGSSDLKLYDLNRALNLLIADGSLSSYFAEKGVETVAVCVTDKGRERLRSGDINFDSPAVPEL
jgi:hypothetical protein